MTKIVNLNRARKARHRQEQERQAAVNRAKFGRPKAERRREAAEESRAARDLAGKKLDRDES